MKTEEKATIDITAKTSEQFAEIEEQLNKLSPVVRSQIRSAKSGNVGLECELFTYEWLNTNKSFNVWLPTITRQITHFGDYIGIYAGVYFFVIRDKDLLKRNPTYLIEEKPSALLSV